jgi:hypothetical protein
VRALPVRIRDSSVPARRTPVQVCAMPAPKRQPDLGVTLNAPGFQLCELLFSPLPPLPKKQLPSTAKATPINRKSNSPQPPKQLTFYAKATFHPCTRGFGGVSAGRTHNIFRLHETTSITYITHTRSSHHQIRCQRPLGQGRTANIFLKPSFLSTLLQ